MNDASSDARRRKRSLPLDPHLLRASKMPDRRNGRKLRRSGGHTFAKSPSLRVWCKGTRSEDAWKMMSRNSNKKRQKASTRQAQDH
jgi:hypothetical protein